MVRMRGIPTLITAVVLSCLACSVGADVIWYSSETNQGSHLWSMDLASGQTTDRGLITGLSCLTDLAMSADGTLYGVAWNNAKASGNSKLVQITAGSISQSASYSELSIKSNKLANSVNGLAWFEGMLYASSAHGLVQQMEYTGSKWEVTKSGNLGSDSAGDLAFSYDGTLYVTLEKGRLATVNLDGPHFGQADVIGQIGYPEVYGLAMIGQTLYGTTAGGNIGPSYLVQLDRATGQASQVQFLTDNVWGATGWSPVTPVPEPTTLALLGLGGLMISVRRFSRA